MLTPRSKHSYVALPANLVETTCEQCGRTLRTTHGRRICARCLGVIL